MNVGERKWIWLICLIAAVRIFLFSAAFPFFNNVDEQAHFDLVHKYSQGYLPVKGLDEYDKESTELILLYGSPEYFSNSSDVSKKQPLWKNPSVKNSTEFQNHIKTQTKKLNHEVGSFPLYYFSAGIWLNLGEIIGLEGGHLLYWIRFLNIPIYIALIWVAYLFSTSYFSSSVQRISLPLLICFYPQDVFYSINSDVLTPLFFSLSIWMLLEIYFKEKSINFHIFTGLAIAATILVKVSNLILLVFVALIITLKLFHYMKHRKPGRDYFSIFLLLITAAIPIVWWFARNYFVLGDLTGSADKINSLTWSKKPLGEIWNHPILSINGVWFFLKELLKTFWRGEFVWYFKRICSESVDSFYIVSTVCLFTYSAFELFFQKGRLQTTNGILICMNYFLIFLSILAFAFLSMRYDFGNCFYPSREQPYFTSGRLMLGILIPFFIIYLDSIFQLLNQLPQKNTLTFITVLVIVSVMTFSEISLTRDVFLSHYNWFHLN